MTIPVLQKCFTGTEGLHAHDFFRKTGIIDDVESGTVFAAIRKEEVHFYYGGARLCLYRTGISPAKGTMCTNNRYLGLPDAGKSRDVRIGDEWFNPDKYLELKSNCCKRRPGESELKIVSRLFPQFSFCASGLPSDRARLIDIEIRFPQQVGSDKKQDMIDCLFITPGGTLVFVEVKRNANSEARGRGGSKSPGVVTQIKGYESQLSSNGAMVDDIKKVYTNVSATLQTITGVREPARTIRDVFRRVPLLIVGREPTPSTTSREVWQRDLLANSPNLAADIIGINGLDCRAHDALDKLFRDIDDQQVS